MDAGEILSLGDDGQVARRPVGRSVAAVRPRAGGGAVIGLERGFLLEDADGMARITVVPPGARMNEGGCDPDGRFYCGSMAFDQSPGAACLYRLDADFTITTVLEGVTVSNGLDWSPDGTLAYYADTPTGRVDVIDYDGELRNRRTFAAIDRGGPDGLTVDAEGGVWVALWEGGAVHRYTAGGELDAVIELPVRHVTACTFGGENLDELFITTSQAGADPPEHPLAGALFRAEPGVRGQPVRPFAG